MECPVTDCTNPVLSNGFCAEHQTEASISLIEHITALQKELAALESLNAKRGSVDAASLQIVQSDISRIKSNIRKYGMLCLESDDCRSRLRKLSVDVEHLLSPDGEPNKIPHAVREDFSQVNPVANIRELNNNISQLSSSDTIDPVISSYQLSKRQEEVNRSKILQLQATIDNIGAESQQLQDDTRTEIQQLVSQIGKTSSDLNRTEQMEDQLQNQLANSQSQSLTVSGHYAAYTAKLQDELDALRVVNDSYRARELLLNASLAQFEESDQQLQSQVRDLRDAYEQKMANLQEDYANRVQQGEQVLSERELELMGDISRLKAALESSMKDLDLANNSNRTAILDLASSERPCGDLAVELLSLKERMSNTSRQMMVLQEERDNLVARKAEYEVQYQRRLADGQAANTSQIQRLNKELQMKNMDISQKQQEVTDMHNDLNALKAASESKISQLNMQLMQTTFELKQFHENQSQQTRMLQEKERMIEDRSRGMLMDNEFKMREAENQLRRRYEDNFKELENRMRFAKSSQEQHSRELQAVRVRQEAKERELAQRQNTLDQSQAAYESKMAEYNRQTEQLNAAIAQAQQRGDQLAGLERDYRKRVEQLRATAAIDREQSQSEITGLKSQLTNALQARALIQANLTECSSTRDAIIMQVNHLTQENAQIKNKFLSLQAQYEQAQIQHSVIVEKLRTEANHLQSNVALCASQLDEVPAVHEHNKQLEAKMAHYRSETEKRERELDGSRANLTKVIAEKEFAAQRVADLEGALMRCDTSKKLLQTTSELSGEQIRDLQRMRSDLEQAAQSNALEFEHVLKDRDREHKRQEQRLKASQTGLGYQVKELEARNTQKQQQIAQLQNQSHRIAESLADSSLQNAQQVRALTNATASGYSQRPTGRSRLVQQ